MVCIEFFDCLVDVWYCICRVGVRVVGMCFYIVVIIWYLLKGRYEGGKYGVCDWGEYVFDVVDILFFVDEFDSDVSSCDSVFEEWIVIGSGSEYYNCFSYIIIVLYI